MSLIFLQTEREWAGKFPNLEESGELQETSEVMVRMTYCLERLKVQVLGGNCVLVQNNARVAANVDMK